MNQEEAALRAYLSKVEADLRSGKATEHTYRPHLKALLDALGNGTNAVNEPKRVKVGAPDYAVIKGSEPTIRTVGHVEAKDIGASLDDTLKTDQLQRYMRGLPSLILTDYLEFRWFVDGAWRPAVRLATRDAQGKLHYDANSLRATADLLRAFLGHRPAPITSSKDLAERMARLAHMIRDLTLAAMEAGEASDTLTDLFQAFKQVLIPELPAPEFADMFAQTLAYGLFAARYNHTGAQPFRRQDAANEIPRTNPFLRKLFGTIAGGELNDEPFIGFVDDLAGLLADADMSRVLENFGRHTRQEDPIVHFYETFLQAYDPKLREVRGVYYTPSPVVSYIVRSVDALLRSEFGCPDGLADRSTTTYERVNERGEKEQVTTPRVLVLDPATGTATFLYMMIAHIREQFMARGDAGMWSGYVRQHLLPRIFGFELLIAPYAMAHLKLGMQLAGLDLPEAQRKDWAYDFQGSERLGVYLTNTLEEAAKRSDVLMGRFISDEANEAANVKREYPVMVVMGNPPYSGHSANKGPWINALLRGKDTLTGQSTGNYFQVDDKPLGERNPKWLNDDYVKFIRFAQWRIERTGHGVLAFITNHGYLDNPTFRGMRQSLMRTFDEIYVLDLHGNSKKKERAPGGGKDENVFDIQQGVAIGVFVKRAKQGQPVESEDARVFHAHLWGERSGKYGWLSEHDAATTEWTQVEPRSPFYFFIPRNTNLSIEYEQGQELPKIMAVNNIGMNTHRDAFAIAFEAATLQQRVADLASPRITDDELRAKYDLEDTSDFYLARARQSVRNSYGHRDLAVPCVYRPFDFRYVLYDLEVVDRPRPELNIHFVGHENVGLVTTRQTREPFDALAVDKVCGQHKIVATYDGSSIFPLYIYPDTSKSDLWAEQETHPDTPGGRRPNLSAEFIADFARRLGMTWVQDGKGDRQTTFGPEDVFSYIYAVLHSPAYRERYADFLKTDFPRIPLTSDPALFRELCQLGDELVALHLLKNRLSPITRYPVRGNNLVEQVHYTEPTGEIPGRVWINKEQYVEGVPPEVWEFHIGGYQVCQKWLKDRKGRMLTYDDLDHYQQTVAALAETRRAMDEIDEAIEDHGGWPLS